MKEPYEKPEMATEEVDLSMLAAQAGSPPPFPVAAAASMVAICATQKLDILE